jgi:hypothetical protein
MTQFHLINTRGEQNNGNTEELRNRIYACIYIGGTLAGNTECSSICLQSAVMFVLSDSPL